MVEKAPPVVVLPGIMGSELSLDGNVVWPDWRDLLTRPHILHPDDPDGRRLVPTAVVEKVVIVPGIIEMAGYGGLLDFLEKELGYQRGVNLFPFAYDWRQDNRTSARLLARRMTKWRKIVGPDVPFTLIGHSLGGLVARYYVQCLNGHRHVNHVITFGTPHRGAPQGFQSFIQGAYIPVLGTFMTDLIKDVLRACGSTYQILPWGPFVVDPHGQHLDIYADRSWLPAEYQERVDLAHEFQQDLAAAGDFPVLMTCWVGYGQSTLLRVEARPGGLNAWQDLSFTPDHAGGDVSVPEPSAILDGMQDWAHFVSEEHGSLFTHPDAQRWLRHVLTSRRTRALESDAGLESRPAAVIQLVLDQMAYAPAAPILVQVQLLDGERAVPDARVLAHVGDDADAGVILE
ncbi:MAG: hypothetical protein KJ734_06165, partial [Chloroflexi bacterium]|nr:hypothetical protein [Chloroflexota bacterium]